jgi:hypothetical protein
MTGHTVLRSIPVLSSCYVALLTFHFVVFSTQRKVSLRMVKFSFVDFGHTHIPALVVGVAGAASRVGNTAMKSGSVFYVGADFLVASHAKPILRFAVKLYMALLAIVFNFGVPLYHLTRRHDGLNALRLRSPYHPNQHQGEEPAHSECHLD